MNERLCIYGLMALYNNFIIIYYYFEPINSKGILLNQNWSIYFSLNQRHIRNCAF